MEIKTCEEYVLKLLGEAEDRATVAEERAAELEEQLRTEINKVHVLSNAVLEQDEILNTLKEIFIVHRKPSGHVNITVCDEKLKYGPGASEEEADAVLARLQVLCHLFEPTEPNVIEEGEQVSLDLDKVVGEPVTTD